MRKILIVEDNEDNLFLFRFILEKRGYEVVEARSGLDGVRLASEEKPDVILMDIQLPGIDGLMATARIRATAEGRQVPIIALTARVMSGDVEKALAAGCDGYIAKPIDVAGFAAEVERYVSPPRPVARRA